MDSWSLIKKAKNEVEQRKPLPQMVLGKNAKYRNPFNTSVFYQTQKPNQNILNILVLDMNIKLRKI